MHLKIKVFKLTTSSFYEYVGPWNQKGWEPLASVSGVTASPTQADVCQPMDKGFHVMVLESYLVTCFL